jgi:hypothetical protein
MSHRLVDEHGHRVRALWELSYTTSQVGAVLGISARSAWQIGRELGLDWKKVLPTTRCLSGKHLFLQAQKKFPHGRQSSCLACVKERYEGWRASAAKKRKARELARAQGRSYCGMYERRQRCLRLVEMVLDQSEKVERETVRWRRESLNARLRELQDELHQMQRRDES